MRTQYIYSTYFNFQVIGDQRECSKFSPSFLFMVKTFLNSTFANWWIGWDGSIAWSSRSKSGLNLHSATVGLILLLTQLSLKTKVGRRDMCANTSKTKADRRATLLFLRIGKNYSKYWAWQLHPYFRVQIYPLKYLVAFMNHSVINPPSPSSLLGSLPVENVP